MNKASERIYKKGEIHENWKQFEKMEIFDSWTDCNDIGNVRDTAGIGKQHAFCNGLSTDSSDQGWFRKVSDEK